MKIRKVRTRYDEHFIADLECEYCGQVLNNRYGNDSTEFRDRTLPDMACPWCGRKGSEYNSEPVYPI
ncbi:MAG: hypothetical protein Q4D04_15595 [Clostridia bacterium]|nr:hypothetical protein [Clostridia bacterium]